MAVPARPVAGALLDAAWGGVVHDAIVAYDLQLGTAIAPSTGAGVDNSSIAVTFARPFASVPVALATSQVPNMVAAISAVSTTGLTINNANRVSGSGSLGARNNAWLAYGPRA